MDHPSAHIISLFSKAQKRLCSGLFSPNCLIITPPYYDRLKSKILPIVALWVVLLSGSALISSCNLRSGEVDSTLTDTLSASEEVHLPFLGVPLCGPLDAYVDTLEAMGMQATDLSPHADEVWLQGHFLGYRAAFIVKATEGEVCQGIIGMEGDSLELAAILDRFRDALIECYAPQFNTTDTTDPEGLPTTYYDFFYHDEPLGTIKAQLRPAEHGQQAMVKIVYVDLKID